MEPNVSADQQQCVSKYDDPGNELRYTELKNLLKDNHGFYTV